MPTHAWRKALRAALTQDCFLDHAATFAADGNVVVVSISSSASAKPSAP